MDSGMTKTVGLAAITVLMAVFVAQAGGGTPMREAGGTIADTTTRDSVITPKWLGDENALALVGVMNRQHIAAADVELSAWHSDTVRAFAAAMARDHAAM